MVTGPVLGANGIFPGAVVIGGGAGTVFLCGEPGQSPCTNQVPEPGVLPLLAVELFGLGYIIRRKYNA